MAKYKYSKYKSDWYLNGVRFDLVAKDTITSGDGTSFYWREINNDKTLGSTNITYANVKDEYLYIVDYTSQISTAVSRWNNGYSCLISFKANGVVYVSLNKYSKSQTTKRKGSFIEEIIAEDGTFPNDGLHSDGFYYVKGALATIPINVLVNGNFIDSEKAYVNVGGVWKEVLEFHQIQNNQWVKLI